MTHTKKVLDHGFVTLRNLMHFLALRTHSHAQVEAQAYANAVVELLEPTIPGLINLYKELVA